MQHAKSIYDDGTYICNSGHRVTFAIALPRLGGTVNQAHIAKGKSTLAAARSALSTERQKRILRGNMSNITSLSAGSRHSLMRIE